MYLPHTTTLPGQEPFPLAVRDEDCGFEGNSDLYGLGIRLGIYMQWLSSFTPRAGSQSFGLLLKTYFIFVFAIFVAILVITREKRPTYTVEMFVLTYIIFGGAYTIMMALKPKKKNPTKPKGIVTDSWVSYLAILSLSDAIAFYCLWFWLRGVHSDNFLDTPCGSYVFVFARVSLSNSDVTKALAGMSGIVAFATLVTGVCRLAYSYLSRPLPNELARPQHDAAEGEDGSADDDTNKNMYKFKDFLVWSLKACYLAYFLIGIELTLYWNGVTHVYSVDTAGQLIPLIIGLCGLAQFLYPPILRRFRR